jgi:small subunit ribosomal protein S14
MAKKSMIERDKKRRILVCKYEKKRSSLKEELKKTSSLEEKLFFSFKLQKLPKNSSFVRLHNRCRITGRPKGFFRNFGVSRLILREMIHDCFVPGIQKASW